MSVTLIHGIIRNDGSLMSRDTLVEEYETREEAEAALAEYAELYKRFGYHITFSEIKDGEKE